MKTKVLFVFAVSFGLLVSGCGKSDDVAEPTSPAPTTQTSSPAETPSPVASEEPEETVAFVHPTDLPDDVLLSNEDLTWADADDVERAVEEDIAPWTVYDIIEQDCMDGALVPAVAMRTVVVDEAPFPGLGVQKVAVFGTEAEAEAEFDKVASRLAACERTVSAKEAEVVADESGGGQTIRFSEPLTLGDQSVGFVIDYSEFFSDGVSGDDAVGQYISVVRRGNAMTLVWLSKGETRVGEARTQVVERTERAASLLCRYDETCSA